MNFRVPVAALFIVLALFCMGQAFDDDTLFVLGAIISGGMAVLIWLAEGREESE